MSLLELIRAQIKVRMGKPYVPDPDYQKTTRVQTRKALRLQNQPDSSSEFCGSLPFWCYSTCSPDDLQWIYSYAPNPTDTLAIKATAQR